MLYTHNDNSYASLHGISDMKSVNKLQRFIKINNKHELMKIVLDTKVKCTSLYYSKKHLQITQ